MRSVLPALIVLCVLFPACDLLWSHGGGTGDSLPFENVEESWRLRVETAGTLVFNDAASWEEFWYGHLNGSVVPPPAIDFEQRTVAGLFWGEYGGCFWAVEAVEEVLEAGRHTVEVREGPLPDLGNCDAVIYPAQFITFHKAQQVAFTGEVPG